MNIPFCDVSIDTLENKDEILQGIHSVLQRADYVSGKEHALFETAFAQYIGKRYCIGVGNGTDAIEIAIESLQLEEGSTIFVQGNSYIATAIAVKNQSKQYKLVLVDVDRDTNMIDLHDLATKAKEEVCRKVIIVTHLFGFTPNMGELMDCCHDNNMLLIEDCAQAHGTSWNGQKAGTFGIVSCFSFYPTKNLGGFGDGGAILTNDTSVYDWIKRRGNMGSVVKNKFDIFGRNSRLDTLQACVLLEKLPYLDANNDKRRKVAALYDMMLRSIPEIQIVSYDSQCRPVYHLYVIRAKQRDSLHLFLKEHGITTLVHYPTCIAKTDAFRSIEMACTPVSEELSHIILSLPMYPGLDVSSVIYIVQRIREFYGHSFSNESVFSFQTKYVDNKAGLLHTINDMSSFTTKRMFYIDGFETADLPVQRGNHCNQHTNELISVLKGAILLEIEYRTQRTDTVLLQKNESYYVPKGTWNRLTILDKNTVVLVCCDTTFDEKVTISDYAVFKGI